MLEMPDRSHLNRAVESRSRSLDRQTRRARRARSPHRQSHRHHHFPTRHSAPQELPYGSRPLLKRDYVLFRPMFALYLDIQKQKVLDDMDTIEAKGRWKSFIGKWNHGELAEGWYDPSTLQKAITSSPDPLCDPGRTQSSGDITTATTQESMLEKHGIDLSNDSDSSVGPAPVGKEQAPRSKRLGPSIPNRQDLELKRGTFHYSKSQGALLYAFSNYEYTERDNEDRLADREQLQLERKAERMDHKARLEELAPRAESGTHERRLENRCTVTSKLNSFAEAKTAGMVDEVPESELFGGGDGDDLKRQKQEVEKKKNERELRKDEFLRVRREEREERLEEYRKKEEETMGMLRAIAKQRFG